MINKLKFGFISSFFFLCLHINAQYSYSLSYLQGGILPHSDYVKPLKANVFGTQIDLLWKLRQEQTSKISNYSTQNITPIIGSSLVFLNNGMFVTGYQFGAGVTVGALLNNHSDFQLGWFFTHGVSYVSEKYDTLKQPVNLAIGSYFNYLAQIKLTLEYNVTPTLSVVSGFNLTHVSNANLAKPNVGLNSLHGNFGLVFYPKEINNSDRTSIYFHKRKYFTNRYLVGLKYAIREHTLEFPQSLTVAIFDFQYRIQKSANHIWDLGFELFSDDNYKFDKFGKLTEVDYWGQTEIGLKVGHQYVFGRLGLRTDLGIYILRPVLSEKPAFYNCIGLDYRLDQNWLLRSRLKAHLNIADYMEFGLAYIWQ